MADILIRGLGMPKDKPVLVFIWPDGRVFPHGLYKPSEWDKVKATPLPEGHGRLIDADALGDFPYNISFCDEGDVENWIAGANTIIPTERGD